uniref:Immunoglobulin V-set domain-containing protein n=1 Tax=Poecilia mexicana TaxID=48701 RepID=A0A3B3X069_9TELE
MLVFKCNYFVPLHSKNVKCEQLTQPAALTVQPGQRLTIRCQVSYDLVYWTAFIRQAAGKGLEWIGMNDKYGNLRFKESLKNKFSIDVDTNSAVYYCDRLDTVTQTSCMALQKLL